MVGVECYLLLSHPRCTIERSHYEADDSICADLRPGCLFQAHTRTFNLIGIINTPQAVGELDGKHPQPTRRSSMFRKVLLMSQRSITRIRSKCQQLHVQDFLSASCGRAGCRQCMGHVNQYLLHSCRTISAQLLKVQSVDSFSLCAGRTNGHPVYVPFDTATGSVIPSHVKKSALYMSTVNYSMVAAADGTSYGSTM